MEHVQACDEATEKPNEVLLRESWSQHTSYGIDVSIYPQMRSTTTPDALSSLMSG